MTISPAYLIAAVLAILASLMNLVRRRWLLNLIALGVQTLASFIVLLSVWPPRIAVIRLIVGLVVTGSLYFTLNQFKLIHFGYKIDGLNSGEIFRLLLGIFVVLSVVHLVPRLQGSVFTNSPTELLLCATATMLLGLLQMGMKAEPFYLILGLFSFLSGFELLYASLEYSALLEAFFTIVNLGLATAVPYIFEWQPEGKL